MAQTLFFARPRSARANVRLALPRRLDYLTGMFLPIAKRSRRTNARLGGRLKAKFKAKNKRRHRRLGLSY
jgi:hypothetical protein